MTANTLPWGSLMVRSASGTKVAARRQSFSGRPLFGLWPVAQPSEQQVFVWVMGAFGCTKAVTWLLSHSAVNVIWPAPGMFPRDCLPGTRPSEDGLHAAANGCPHAASLTISVVCPLLPPLVVINSGQCCCGHSATKRQESSVQAAAAGEKEGSASHDSRMTEQAVDCELRPALCCRKMLAVRCGDAAPCCYILAQCRSESGETMTVGCWDAPLRLLPAD